MGLGPRTTQFRTPFGPTHGIRLVRLGLCFGRDRKLESHEDVIPTGCGKRYPGTHLSSPSVPFASISSTHYQGLGQRNSITLALASPARPPLSGQSPETGSSAARPPSEMASALLIASAGRVGLLSSPSMPPLGTAMTPSTARSVHLRYAGPAASPDSRSCWPGTISGSANDGLMGLGPLPSR